MGAGVNYPFGAALIPAQQSAGITRPQAEPNINIATPLGSRQVLPALPAGAYVVPIHPQAVVLGVVPPAANTQPISVGGYALAEGRPFLMPPSPLTPPGQLTMLLGGTGLATGTVIMQD